MKYIVYIFGREKALSENLEQFFWYPIPDSSGPLKKNPYQPVLF